MIIRQLSCERFAGVQDASLSLKPGMNVLLGDNESGKSTMADLLYQLFFQDVKLDGRKDKVFLDTYFPKGLERDGDIIDGTVRFETEQGVYKLYKEWSPGGSLCRLTTPDGTRISSPDAVKKTLEAALGYGKGICDEVVFPSQKRPQTLLSALLESKKDKKKDAPDVLQDLTATLHTAVLETGGVSLDKLESRLLETLAGFTGHWDLAADGPEKGRQRGIENPWKTGCGSILERYYDLSRARKRQRDTEDVEKRLEGLNRRLQSLRQQRSQARQERDRFLEFQGALLQRENYRKLSQSLEQRLQEMQLAAVQWPEAEDRRDQARKQQLQLEQAELLQLYRRISGLHSRLEEKEAALEDWGPVEPADVTAAEAASANIRRLEATIRGLNLAAELTVLGDTPVEVVSGITGEAIAAEGSFSITEAVEITAPGVLRLQLMPRGVDLEKTRAALEENRNALAAILQKYGVDSIAQLQERRDRARELESDIRMLRGELEREPADRDFPALARKAQALPREPEAPEEIRRQIRLLCGLRSAESFAGQQEGLILGFRQKFGSLAQLAQETEAAQQQLQQYRQLLSAAGDIPEEYRSVTDPEAYLYRCKQAVEDCDAALEQLHRELRENQLPPEAPSAEECAEECMQLQERFEEEKRRYRHYQHIYDVFRSLREQELGDPTRDIQVHFREYLSLLSADGIRLQEMDEKLRPALVSGNARLSFNILSEGTKDTIALAFRLAMLEHLYPEGGAVAVFDDPFTDMDQRRRRQACRLLQRFAQGNQVVFLTCDEDFGELLGGNLIQAGEVFG